MKSKLYVSILLAAGLTLTTAITPATAFTISVPGTSDMWLAGMPDGSTASNGDVAPTHSPVLATGLNLSIGLPLAFSATGGVSNNPGCPPTCDGPDGGGFVPHFDGAQNGISDIRAPLNSLLGVFLGNNQPDFTPSPEMLDFELMGTDFTSLSPVLKQVFFIGDGLTGTGTGNVQIFDVPLGATRLFLGTMDGFGWFNNSGSFAVDVAPVPLPGAFWLLGPPLIAFASFKRFARKM